MNKGKMKNIVYTLLLIFVIISCNQSKKENFEITKKTEQKLGKISGDSVNVPNFEIKLNLSEKAEKTLKEKNESIISSVDFLFLLSLSFSMIVM